MAKKEPRATAKQRGLFPALERLKAEEERLRAEKITLLRAELAKARETVRAVERELRLAGASQEDLGGGRMNWEELYEELGPTFTAKEVRELTGANSNLVASIIFRWREQGRIEGAGGRGEYRKKR